VTRIRFVGTADVPDEDGEIVITSYATVRAGTITIDATKVMPRNTAAVGYSAEEPSGTHPPAPEDPFDG
jgi:hypothetical protein